MNTHDFISLYGGIYEHSPWVAEEVAALAAGIDDADRLAALMAECVDNAGPEKQLALLRAHPDLAGKAQTQRALDGLMDAQNARANIVDP